MGITLLFWLAPPLDIHSSPSYPCQTSSDMNFWFILSNICIHIQIHYLLTILIIFLISLSYPFLQYQQRLLCLSYTFLICQWFILSKIDTHSQIHYLKQTYLLNVFESYSFTYITFIAISDFENMNSDFIKEA